MTPREVAHLPECCPLCGAPASPRLLVAHIQATVAAYYGTNVRFMASEHRDREFAHPRQVAMYLAHELTPRSYPEIGRRFNRDHTTVIYAVRAIRKRISNDPELAMDVGFLRGRLMPAETGDKRPFSLSNDQQAEDKEQNRNKQEESLAA